HAHRCFHQLEGCHPPTLESEFFPLSDTQYCHQHRHKPGFALERRIPKALGGTAANSALRPREKMDCEFLRRASTATRSSAFLRLHQNLPRANVLRTTG